MYKLSRLYGIAFSLHDARVFGLCILMIVGSSCQNKLALSMQNEPTYTEREESPERRKGIGDFEMSPAGIMLLKQFEGFRSEPYYCAAGALTVGYGQTISKEQEYSISEREADALLDSKLSGVYVPDIKRLVKVPLHQREFDMLVSLDYNIGATALCGPSSKPQNSWTQIDMLTPLNNRDYAKASLAFPKFTKGGPERPYYRGLLKRRMTEMFVFRNRAGMPEALRAPIEDDNFRKFANCDSIAKYWEASGQQNLRDEAVLLYKAYNDQLRSSETTR